MTDLRLGPASGGLEIRREGDGGVRLSGRFPYNSPAVLSDGGRAGRPVKEMIEPGAFAYSLEEADADIALLHGHSWDKPLASRKAGTLTFRDTASALLIAATIVPAVARSTYASDALAQIEAGLAVGLSPGFRLPPERAVPRVEAEVIEDEPDRPEQGQHRAIIRRIRQAILAEISVVSRPAYADATVEFARDFSRAEPRQAAAHLRRWRL